MRRAALARVGIALAISLSAHGVILAALRERAETMLVAGGGVEAAALGNSFEDMAIAGGILQPIEGETAAPETPQATDRPVETSERAVSELPRQEPLKPAEISSEGTVSAPVLHTLEASDPPPGFAPGEVAALPAAPDAEKSNLPAPASRVAPMPAGNVPPSAEPAQVTPAETAQRPERETPKQPDRTDAIAQQERTGPVADKAVETARLTGEPPKPAEDDVAPPAPVEKPKKKAQPAKPKKQVSQGPGKGAAVSEAIRGSADGSPDAVASSKSNGKGPAGPGNASVSNYPGQVYARIRRTRQSRVGGRGVVRVAFTIMADGGLGSISVSQGSGAEAVDRAALDHVRRSAPFPAPPPGAQTKFVIPIEVRG